MLIICSHPPNPLNPRSNFFYLVSQQALNIVIYDLRKFAFVHVICIPIAFDIANSIQQSAILH